MTLGRKEVKREGERERESEGGRKGGRKEDRNKGRRKNRQVNNWQNSGIRKKSAFYMLLPMHFIIAFLTMPAQWSQKVGVKYVVSWKVCEKPLLKS